jgi:hypothetical protein
MIVICDIDGTIADNSHREGFIQGGQKDWDSFYKPELMERDTPIAAAMRALPELVSKVQQNFFFLTGRPERTRETTAAWIKLHFGISTRRPGETHVFPGYLEKTPQMVMRGNTDRRPAHVYKQSLCEFLHTGNGRPLLFIDDDLRNEEMYKLYGIFLHAPQCWEVFR